jgi:hypothetical protein
MKPSWAFVKETASSLGGAIRDDGIPSSPSIDACLENSSDNICIHFDAVEYSRACQRVRILKGLWDKILTYDVADIGALHEQGAGQSFLLLEHSAVPSIRGVVCL